ncbi:MAG: sigma-54 dependent transcriptional regulator [Lentisphaerales bacterium]|nr:sigma-54 dependent transcriptional regulator [Lentisphaerales bacterium]
MKKEIYFCDDDNNILYAMKLIMHKTPFKATFFDDPIEMISQLKPDWPGIIVTDLTMPKINGFEVIERVKNIDPDIPVIVLTGNGDIGSVVKALRAGAYDFLEKPLSKDYLIESAKRALEKSFLRLENKVLRRKVTSPKKANMLGQATAMLKLKEICKNVANSEASVMIIGETGTGKEVTAKFIHDNSDRADNVFTAINCGAVPENLMDSELFGHEAGAFTGAAKSRKGKIEQSHGGTLFLDEVNSMPMAMQVKLLRVLEERAVEKLGGNSLTKVDIRLIAASQVDLKELVKDGQFREDLYYRLNVIPVRLPALRNRREDIPLLFNHFVFEYCTQYNREIIEVSEDTISKLIVREWEGNVRELRNIAERFVITGFLPDEEIDFNEAEIDSQGGSFSVPDGLRLPEMVGAYEKYLIEEEFKKNNGGVENTYQGLGIPRKTLYDKIKKYNINRKLFKS